MNNIKIHNLHKQAQLSLNQGQYQQAHHYLVEILQQDKYFADAYFLLAMIASDHHQYKKAIQLIEQAMVLSPYQAEYLAQLAKHFALIHKHIDAKKYADQASQLENKTALTFDTIGTTYSRIGLHELAVQHFKRAITKQPDNAIFHFNLGSSLKFTGNFTAAKLAFQTCLTLKPEFYKAYTSLSSLGALSKSNADKLQQLSLIENHLINADDQLYLAHAQAREYEAKGQYQLAFNTLVQAKNKKCSEIDYTFASDQALFSSITEAFSSPDCSVQEGHHTAEPIFVVGMPRTGTTLVERIISQHPEVTSAGELQHFGLLLKEFSATQSQYIIDPATVLAAQDIDFKKLGETYIESTRVLTGNTARFIDKMPLNFLYVGFILSALPNSKIICLDRNPLDTIMSNFRQLFAVNFSYYNYAYDVATTTEYYLQFKALISFWQKKYAKNFYVVNYEKLVNDPLSEAKKIMQFCDLSWQDSYLDIHLNTSPVATASAVQVRHPINNKSVGNWQKYKFCLTDANTRIKEHCDKTS